MDTKLISGFSKLSKEEKLKVIVSTLEDKAGFITEINSLNHRQPEKQALLEQFSENTLGNFPLPYGVAPNFLINDRVYSVPMVTEESSIVAATASAARFWSERGGFHAVIKGSLKIGQIHFCWFREKEQLQNSFEELKVYLMKNTMHLTQSMENRGGGVKGFELIDFTDQLDNYFQIRIGFETSDIMGANFINSVLEEMASLMKEHYSGYSKSTDDSAPLEIIMAILSNYTPECIVECFVETSITSLETIDGKGKTFEFLRKFKKAFDIAEIDPFRAVTHNKGIFNGIDAVVLATANDFRAVEAAGHAFAARNGKYGPLSKVELTGDVFRMSLELPMAVGTIGGLTNLHPMAKWSFEILNKPNSHELMMIIAAAGLASNFSAIKSLVTSGIQKGHMKLHLGNILSLLGTGEDEKSMAIEHFQDRKVSYQEVKHFLTKIKTSE